MIAHKTTLVATLLILSLVCAAAGDFLACRYAAIESQIGFSSCSGNSYDVRTQICCYDDSVAVDNICLGGADCEGGKAFIQASDKACCGGRYLTLSQGVNQICCGGEFVDVMDNFECCGGSYKELEFGSNSRCCDGGIIDAESTACCTAGTAEKAHPRDSLKACCDLNYLAKPANSLCCNGVVVVVPGVGTSPACCGTEVIDEKKTTCCEATQFANQEGFRCCGNTYGSLEETECCGSSRYTKQLNKACCGEQYYSFQSESCAGEVCSSGVVCEGTDRAAATCGICDFDRARQQCFEVFFLQKSAASSVSAGALMTILSSSAIALLL